MRLRKEKEASQSASTAHMKSWSDVELHTLSKALSKFPGGTYNRWHRIAEFIGTDKTGDDVLAMSKELDIKALASKGMLSL